MENNNYYYRINHKNSFDYFDSNSLMNLKSLLFSELSGNDDVIIGTNINKLFNKILNISSKENNLDKLDLLYNLFNQFIQKNNLDLTDINYFKNLCQKISISNYKMEFNFSFEFINDVILILTFAYYKLKQINYFKTYDNFIETLKKYSNKDLICIYRENKLLPQFIIPNEFILLMNIFQGIKKLNFNLNENYIIEYVLILLNFEWLFPYVFSIKFDMNCNKLYKNINNEYKKKIFDLNKKRKNSIDSNDSYNSYSSNNNNNNKNENENYINIINNNKDIFNLIIIYCFFICKFKFLNNLELIVPDSFKLEIEKNLNINEIEIYSFNFLNFFINLNNLIYLNIEFNSFENETFENILSIIQNNIYLKYLTISFFSSNEEQYKEETLLKTLESNGYSMNNLFINDNNNNNDYFYENENLIYNNNNLSNININKEIIKNFDNENNLTNLLLNKLMLNFEENLEKFFILIQTKKNIEFLSMIFNEPILIINNEKFFWILTKILFNILLMINNEKFNNLNELKLLFPYLIFDNRKKIFIENFFEKINFYNLSQKLKKFSIQIQILNLPNFINIISKNFEYLFIGDLDIETFNNFIIFYQKENFIKESKLKYLKIKFAQKVIEFNENVSFSFKKFLNGNNPKNLNTIEIDCKIYLNLEIFENLIENINKNQVEKYIFYFKQINPNEFNKFNYDKYFYLNEEYEKMINKYLNVINKCGFVNNKNIFKKIFKFLLPSNKKEIEIINI